jgi:hypothetical protein
MNVREDALLPLVEEFFANRLFGPMGLDKLAVQLSAQESSQTADSKRMGAELRRQIATADNAIAAQVRGLEAGVDADLVQARIVELKAEKTAAQATLSALLPAPADGEDL